jgi:hypothetical protein
MLMKVNDCVLVAADVPKDDAITQTREDFRASASFRSTFCKLCHADVSTQMAAVVGEPCRIDACIQTEALYDQAAEPCKAETSFQTLNDVPGTSNGLPVRFPYR